MNNREYTRAMRVNAAQRLLTIAWANGIEPYTYDDARRLLHRIELMALKRARNWESENTTERAYRHRYDDNGNPRAWWAHELELVEKRERRLIAELKAVAGNEYTLHYYGLYPCIIDAHGNDCYLLYWFD